MIWCVVILVAPGGTSTFGLSCARYLAKVTRRADIPRYSGVKLASNQETKTSGSLLVVLSVSKRTLPGSNYAWMMLLCASIHTVFRFAAF